MPYLNLKPNHKAVQTYYKEINVIKLRRLASRVGNHKPPLGLFNK
jgi:hypothetical protein